MLSPILGSVVGMFATSKFVILKSLELPFSLNEIACSRQVPLSGLIKHAQGSRRCDPTGGHSNGPRKTGSRESIIHIKTRMRKEAVITASLHRCRPKPTKNIHGAIPQMFCVPLARCLLEQRKHADELLSCRGSRRLHKKRPPISQSGSAIASLLSTHEHEQKSTCWIPFPRRIKENLLCWWGSWRVKVAAEPSCHDWGQRLS